MKTLRFKRCILISGICIISLFVKPEPGAKPLLEVCSRWSASLSKKEDSAHISGSGEIRTVSQQNNTDHILSSSSITTNIGTLVYYNQSDPRWGSYLYGGCDPMYAYGCGPTSLAMIVNSVTPMIPSQMAQWASDHGYWSQGQGSSHRLIKDALASFGFQVESLTDTSPESLKSALYDGKVLVLLMGPGHFTDNGHFILLTGMNGDGSVRIADPNNSENTQISWDAGLISSELSQRATAGGPAWAVSAPG